MLKNLFYLVVIGGLAYFLWGYFTTPEPVAPSPPTPEQEVAALAISGVIPAKNLALLCEKYPDLVKRALQGKMVTVSGILNRGLVTGVAGTDLVLELDGTKKYRVTFQSDFQRFSRMQQGGVPPSMKFQKHGNEIIAMPLQSSNSKSGNVALSKSNAAGDPKALNSTKFILRESENVTLRGLFKHIGPISVRIELRAFN